LQYDVEINIHQKKKVNIDLFFLPKSFNLKDEKGEINKYSKLYQLCGERKEFDSVYHLDR